MMEDVSAWLQSHEGPLSYLALALAAMIEYVVPPFPGDSIALLGIFLAATAGYGVGWVYLALNAGALVGGMLAYGFGRWWGLRREARAPRFLRSERARRAIEGVLERFERHGPVYLALNRFVPAMRAFFFVAAGIVRVPAWKVALYGTASAMLWNALLLGLGWLVGDNYARLEELVTSYSYVAVAVVTLLVAVVAWRAWRGDEGAD